MTIWANLLIPIIAIVSLFFIFNKKIAWWEYILIFGVALIAISLAKVISVTTQTSDTEYLNSYIIRAEYFEPWDEWIYKRCCQTCYDQCWDSEGDSYSCRPHDCWCRDCSYRSYHNAHWTAMDNTGHHIGMGQGGFENLSKMWGSRQFVELNRHFYRQDGNKYITISDTILEHIQPICRKHTYENKVKCSKRAFDFKDVDTSDIHQYGLFDYPAFNEANYNPIQGINDPGASQRLQQYNARYGSMKQVHMMILVFHNQPQDAAEMQEDLWKGGNKNEFTLCIGLDSHESIIWTKVISWTDVKDLKHDVEDQIGSMDSLDMKMIIDYMAHQVSYRFVRKQFKDFSYIKVEPTNRAIWVTFVITLLITGGLSVFSVLNTFTRKNPSGE